jgi:hypothetical protein
VLVFPRADEGFLELRIAAEWNDALRAAGVSE